MAASPWLRWTIGCMTTLIITGGLLAAFFEEPFRRVWVFILDDLRVFGGCGPRPPEPGPPPPPAPHDPWADPQLPAKLPRALGNDPEDSYVGELLEPLTNPTLGHEHGRYSHYGYVGRGLEITFDEQRRLVAVRLHAGRPGAGYACFMGTCPGGVRLISMADLTRETVQERLATWRKMEGRSLDSSGDLDCYVGAGDEWCIVFEPDGDQDRGNNLISNLLLTMTKGNPLSPGDLGCDPNGNWPEIAPFWPLRPQSGRSNRAALAR